MKITNIAAYINAKVFRESAPGKIVKGKLLVYHRGKWISNEDFIKATPEPSKLLQVIGYKGENKCTRVANIS